MISWIQKNLQQHFRVIFLVLLGCVIVAFVFTIGAQGDVFGGKGHKKYTRMLFGMDMNEPENQRRVFGDAGTSVYLQAGYNLLSSEQLNQYALRRFALLKMADEVKLPSATSEEVDVYIQTLGAFADEKGKFDRKRYDQFVDMLKTNPNWTEGDIYRVVVDDIRWRKMESLLAGPGFVQMDDVIRQAMVAGTKWGVSLATADYAGFAPKIAVSEEELAKFLADNPAKYEEPEKMRVSVVEFKTKDFLKGVAVTDAEVRKFYEANPARFPKPESSKKATEPELSLATTPGVDVEKDFAEVKGAVESALRLERASALASKAAADFSLALYNAKVPASGLDGFLKAKGLGSRELKPFTRAAGPAEFAGDTKVSEEAFKLGEGMEYSDVVKTPDGYVLVVWKEKLPARMPMASEIKGQLTEDYKAAEKKKLFFAAGEKLSADVKAAMAKGDSFAKAVETAKASSGLSVSVKDVPEFTLRKPPEGVAMGVFGALGNMQAGSVSDMMRLEDGNGVMVFVKTRELPNLESNPEELAQMRQQLGQMLANMDVNEYVTVRLNEEFAKMPKE